MRRSLGWWLGGFLLATGALFVWASLRLSLGTPQKPGPGTTPLLFALILVGCAVLILLERRVPEERMAASGAWRGVALIAALALAYPVVLRWAGFSLGTAALVFGASLALGMKRAHAMWLSAAAVGAAVLLFRISLGVPLPPGLLGI